jgi:3-hydroxyisobutyrate dehydrogenase-like beta-hydroxyacid dehydrogenase
VRVVVFGLGEAGSPISADLARAGADVHGFDPAAVATPEGVRRHDDPKSAAADAELVIAVTASADSGQAMAQAWDVIGPGTQYADLATSNPTLKRALAARAAEGEVLFTDVALMAPVPGRGLATPALASGTGASRLAGAINPLGGRVDVIGVEAGAAAARKLIRSVVTKGLAGLVIESLAAARAAGQEEWAWNHIVELLTTTDEAFLRRLLEGTETHVGRRLAEMEATAEFLADLGVPADMTAGTIEHLRRAHPATGEARPERT